MNLKEAAVQRHGDQVLVPAALMRGGTSRGPFFLASDLPGDTESRDRVLMAAMGSEHPLQVDGVGGGHPLTSKAGIVQLSVEPGVDLDFTFAQLQPGQPGVQTTANCGNMLAAVLPFAIERGLLAPDADTTTAVVRTLNTGLKSEITVQTPFVAGHRTVAYEGATALAGTPGTAAGIQISFLDTEGSIAGSLLPTGTPRESFTLPDGRPIEATCLDNGQPMVVLRASDLGISGGEAVAELEAEGDLKAAVEHIRLAAGQRMGLGDVADVSYPKMTIVAAPSQGGDIRTRSLIPHSVHTSIGVLAAVTVATAARLEGSVAADYPGRLAGEYNIEHPSGVFQVSYAPTGGGAEKVGIIRTSRLLMAGAIAVPAAIYSPNDKD